MDHVAIMNKSWNLLPKILSGEKRIESRWYKAKFPPWNRIQKGDVIYFKDAGDLIRVRAEVEKVLEYENYTDDKLEELIQTYGRKGGIAFVNDSKSTFLWAKERKYCILIFLKNPRSIVPFQINKTGFGNACAWICIDNINKIKII